MAGGKLRIREFCGYVSWRPDCLDPFQSLFDFHIWNSGKTIFPLQNFQQKIQGVIHSRLQQQGNEETQDPKGIGAAHHVDHSRNAQYDTWNTTRCKEQNYPSRLV